MFLTKVKKWLVKEINDLDRTHIENIHNDNPIEAYGCNERRDALMEILYLINYKKPYDKNKTHGIFKNKESKNDKSIKSIFNRTHTKP